MSGIQGQPEPYVRILDGEPVEVVRYRGDPEALRAWGGPGVRVAGDPPGAFVGPTEVFAGDRAVKDGAGNLRVVSPPHFRLLYRFGCPDSGA